MGYCFMRFEKIKTSTSFTGKYAHNFRTMEVPNANPSLRHFNEELIGMPEGETYYSLYKKKVRESPIYADHKPRKDAVKGLEFVLEYNPKTVGEDFDEDKWKEENVKWLTDTFGKENVISAVCHRDEGAGAYYGSCHIHAIVIPMRDGRLNAKHYTGGRRILSDLQTSYGKYMERVGLERGLQGSHAKHMDIQRFYAAENKILADELPMPKENENIYEYRERVNAMYVDSNLKHFSEKLQLQQKVNEARTMDMNDKLELSKLRKQIKTSEKAERQAQRFEEILNGLKHGYFETPEQNEEFKKQMQEISQWERTIGKDRESQR